MERKQKVQYIKDNIDRLSSDVEIDDLYAKLDMREDRFISSLRFITYGGVIDAVITLKGTNPIRKKEKKCIQDTLLYYQIYPVTYNKVFILTKEYSLLYNLGSDNAIKYPKILSVNGFSLIYNNKFYYVSLYSDLHIMTFDIATGEQRIYKESKKGIINRFFVVDNRIILIISNRAYELIFTEINGSEQFNPGKFSMKHIFTIENNPRGIYYILNDKIAYLGPDKSELYIVNLEGKPLHVMNMMNHTYIHAKIIDNTLVIVSQGNNILFITRVDENGNSSTSRRAMTYQTTYVSILSLDKIILIFDNLMEIMQTHSRQIEIFASIDIETTYSPDDRSVIVLSQNQILILGKDNLYEYYFISHSDVKKVGKVSISDYTILPKDPRELDVIANDIKTPFISMNVKKVIARFI